MPSKSNEKVSIEQQKRRGKDKNQMQFSYGFISVLYYFYLTLHKSATIYQMILQIEQSCLVVGDCYFQFDSIRLCV